MDRLVDYFAVVGYDFEDDKKDAALRGKILTRIPEIDHEDVGMRQGIELFCQPAGWYLVRKKEPPPPTFFVAVLTDDLGNQYYCAVHSFYEPIKSFPSHVRVRHVSNQEADSTEGTVETGGSKAVGTLSKVDEDVDESLFRVEVSESDEAQKFLSNNSDEADNAEFSYAPKCLVLLSRVRDFRVLKNCLGLIYTIYIEGMSVSMELVVAKLMLVNVPPPGSSLLRFSIGAADEQALQTPKSDFLPVTSSSVTMLLRQLGILNVMNILCAALVDQKILFYSCSYSRLADACKAVTALMYPFTYSYPFIPILPHYLLMCTSSPTPFLFGIHSSFKHELQDLLDVICVDLDGGVISVPECVTLPQIPEPYYTSTVEALTKVLCPDLVVADYAYPPDQVNPSEPEKLDKEIRAIFLRLFSQLLMGYRSCLQLCRINPLPILRFEKESYLTMRGFDVNNTPSANEFLPKLLESQAFQLFVQNNGPPYRKLHMFDKVVAEIPDRIQSDINDVYKALEHVDIIASKLYLNEIPNHTKVAEKIPKPSDDAYKRPNQPTFPKISATAVQAFMEEHRDKVDNHLVSRRKRSIVVCERVPEGTRLSSYGNRGMGSMLSTSSRRLEVMKNCLSFIFDSKTLEIKKIFQAVLRALKSRTARSALTHELALYAKNRPRLDNQQFDFIARLINCSLQDSSGQLDENTIAADLLPIVTTFYRNLCPTVMQFMYSVVQDHAIWTSSLFWEKAFFVDVQDEIKNLYSAQSTTSTTTSTSTSIPKSPSQLVMNGGIGGKRDNQMCMEIAARELKKAEKKTEEEKRADAQAEESIIFSQAQHCAHRMVFMLVPLDSSRANRMKFLHPGEEASTNSFFTSSLNGSINASYDDESGFDESQDNRGDVAMVVSKFISKFVDRVCTESSINSEHTKTLVNKVSSLVHMQMECLQDVCRESKRLPPIQKAKLMSPQLLIGESVDFMKPLRAYLIGDGRATATGGNIGGPSLLPAEGAIYVTNYRVIFIGVPCDALAAEQVVIRSFPISGLFKMKPFNSSDVQGVGEIDNNSQYGLQLRSCTFQLMVLAFDEEVTSEEHNRLQADLQKRRYPLTIDGAFAVSAARFTRHMVGRAESTSSSTNSYKSRTKRFGNNNMATATMTAGMEGAKTLMKQAKRKAGMDKNRTRISRLIDTKNKTLYYPATAGAAGAGSTGTLGRMPIIDERMSKTLSDKSTLTHLSNLSGEEDFKRIGLLGNSVGKFHLTRVNRMFSVCRTYPVCAVVPKTLTDEQVKSLAHCHNQYRFPAIVWMHPTTKTLLIRSSAIRSRTASSLFKHGQTIRSDEGTPGSSSELERFLIHVSSFSTCSHRKDSGLFPRHLCDSVESGNRNSQFISDDIAANIQKKNNLMLKTTGLARNFASSVRKRRPTGTTMRHPANGARQIDRDLKSSSKNSSSESLYKQNQSPNESLKSSSQSMIQPLRQILTRHAQLYVFGEKAQLKGMKQEQQGRVLFVPIDFVEPKQIRFSFKNFLKAILPADPPNPTPTQSTTTSRTSSAQSPNSAVGGQSGGGISELYLKAVQESGWLDQVSSLLQTAGAAVDVMDIQGSSVMIAVDDGSDITPQISSLTQLLSDPYYRTIEGFRVLIQKEWLSFGHRFSHRNRFNDVQSSGFTPVFLQFLDAVFQVHSQFQMSFEFNMTFIETIAYHSISNRFTTFLLDSDYERLEAGILFDTTRSPHQLYNNTVESVPCNDSLVIPAPKSTKDERFKSLWDYIAQAHSKSPVFLNSLYMPERSSDRRVIRPVSATSVLKVWPYYVREALGDGPPYDSLSGELTAGGTSHNEQEATETSEAWGGATARRVVNRCYDNVADAQPSSIKMLLQQIERLQIELGIGTTGSWNKTWKDFNERPPEGELSNDLILARNEIRDLHKRATVDLLHKSLDVFEDSNIFSVKLRNLAVSSTNLMSSAASSQLNLFDRKASVIAEELEAETRYINNTSDSSADSLDDEVASAVDDGDAPTIITKSNELLEVDASSLQFRTQPEETRTFEGLLYKQGAYMKAWKLRFFVLDITKHELRQYESPHDTVCKTIIDLKDLESVHLAEALSGAPKTATPKSFITLKLSKRPYHFIAQNDEAACTWVEKLQAAL